MRLRGERRAGGASLLDAAVAEATALGHGIVAQEHLVLACLRGRPGLLAQCGVSLEDVHEDVAVTLPRESAARLDEAALASIGIDLDEVRRRAEERFGPGALERTRAARGGCALPIRPDVKRALEAARLRAGHVTAESALASLVRLGDPATLALLDRHGLTAAVAETLPGEAA
jgi:hypothetical protein